MQNMLLGYSYLKKENYSQAINYFEQLGRTVSSSSSPLLQDAFIRLADAYFMTRDYAKARSLYDAVTNSSLPQSDYAFYQKAMIAGINSPGKRSVSSIAFPRNTRTVNWLGDVNMEIANTYMSQEKFRDAIPYLNKIINSNKFDFITTEGLI